MRKRSIPGKRVTVTSGSRVRISVTPRGIKQVGNKSYLYFLSIKVLYLWLML